VLLGNRLIGYYAVKESSELNFDKQEESAVGWKWLGNASSVPTSVSGGGGTQLIEHVFKPLFGN